MKNFKPAEMVRDATEEIQKFAPRNSIVDIDVTEDPVGHYCTNIKLHTKNRTYFAKKEDDFLYKSFTKALRALKTQLQKKRINRLHETVGLKNNV